MMISTRGRYALRVMLDLADNKDAGYIPMKEVAAKQELSLKYLEKILPVLAKNDLIEGVHGKGGGYRLKKLPEEITIGEILRLTEGDLAPVSCLEQGAEPCQYTGECRTLPLWKKLNEMVNDYLNGITLADLMNNIIV